MAFLQITAVFLERNSLAECRDHHHVPDVSIAEINNKEIEAANGETNEQR